MVIYCIFLLDYFFIITTSQAIFLFLINFCSLDAANARKVAEITSEKDKLVTQAKLLILFVSEIKIVLPAQVFQDPTKPMKI